MNIAEILKNCPKGTKLYSPMWGNVELSRIKPSNYIEITVLSNNFTNTLYPDGRYTKEGECMLFPSKEQRDWNEFLFPFKDGDIIILEEPQGHNFRQNIAIFKGYSESGNNRMEIYCQVDTVGIFIPYSMFVLHKGWRLATDDEKLDFFTIMNRNGYQWKNGNLTRLLPRFGVGDCIIYKYNTSLSQHDIIKSIKEGRYELNDGSCLFFKDQDDYEIVKFNTSMVKELEFVKLAGIWFVELPDYDGDPWDLEMVAGADTLCDMLAKNGRVKVSLATNLDDLDPICAPDYTLDFINSTVSNGLQDGANYKVRELDLDVWLCNVTKYVFGEFPTTIYISLL